ncbi:MAG TPA: transglutaminaseTgpA domain-containing protein [Frankiaceae bacterium]|nr:transglutaminaseTgpA domain-containing protein [Frankiaceae bacterium]
MTNRQSMMLPAAAASVILTMMSLSQVFDRQRWFFPSLFGVLVAFGIGWAARRLDVPGILAPAVSLLAMLTFLGLVFVPETTLAGLPTPDTMRGIGDLLSAAGTDLREMAPPAEATEALTLLATGGVFVVAMVVDLVVFWTRRPVAAGMPLLALFLIPTTMTNKANVFAFVLAAVGYLTLLVAEGRDRARGWGRRLSGMDLVDDVADVSHVVRVGRRIGSAAVGLALCVPLLVPDVGEGIFRGNGGMWPGRGNGSRTATVINPLVEIKAQLRDDRIIPLLEVRTDEPQYLRLTSLDAFNGEEWSLVKRDVKSDHRVGEDKPLRQPEELDLISAPTHRYDIAVRDLAVHWLPIPYIPSRVDVDGDWRYEEFGYSVFSAENKSNGVRFTAESRIPEPTVDQLKAPGEIPGRIREQYLAVPAQTPDIAVDVLAEVTTGKENAYDIALALNEYFYSSGQFTYDDNVAQANGVDALTHFLTEKRGYCEQYAATMAYLARLKGIPARVVVGFTPGKLRNDGTYVVTNKEAHAWPELYFPQAGWVRFEPTPRAGTTVRPPHAVPPVSPPGATLPPDATPTDEPSAAPSSTASPRPQNVPDIEDDTPANPALAGGDDGGVPVVPLAAGGVLLLAATPALVGAGTRRRRRGLAADGAGQIHAAWESLADAAEDAGYPLRDADSPRGAARRLVAAASLSGPVADEVRRLAAAEERARYARTVPSADGLDGGVRTVRKAMIAALPRWARLRATVFPASSVRRIVAAVRAVGDGVDRARTRTRVRLLSLVRRRTRTA